MLSGSHSTAALVPGVSFAQGYFMVSAYWSDGLARHPSLG